MAVEINDRLYKTACDLSDALMGGKVFQTGGADRQSVLEAARYPGKPLVDALERLNGVLREIDRDGKFPHTR